MAMRNLIRLAMLGAVGLLALTVAAYFAIALRKHALPPFGEGPAASVAGQRLGQGHISSYDAPQFAGITAWLNSAPLTLKALRGKVVLVDFWTYACIDCVRALPYTTEWDRKYREQGLMIVGVHSPEFEAEKNTEGLRAAIARYGIRYPVAQDNHLDTWRNFANRTWPAHYLIDRNGRVVYTHFGEGGYDLTESNIRYLLGLSPGEIQAAAEPRYAPPHARALQPGKVFKDCAYCPSMVAIPSGAFEMGQQPNTHRVVIAHAFALGRYEVTQAEWKAVMGNSPSRFTGAGLPVEQVNWQDAQEFIRKLNRRTGRQYRLPTEAEWEYACRAGEAHEYCGSDDADRVAWFGAYGTSGGNSSQMTHRVGTRQANAFGLYDMSGNVWEWVADPWHDGYLGAPGDGSMWAGDGAKRVIRGGSWLDYPLLARAGFRVWAGAGKRSSDLGFRVARTLPK